MPKIQNALAPQTSKVFEAITRLDCILPFTLVGGTALSLQLGKRLSEDLDFMKWQTTKSETPDVNWPAIQTELETVGEIRDLDIGGFDFVQFNVEGVKVSFYAAPRRVLPSMQRIQYLNNLFLADVASIGAMKMETLLRRAKFRDYYDIYSILMEGHDIQSMMTAALQHSEYKLKSRNLMAMLTNGALFPKEEGFELMQPLYDVTPIDIQEFIKQKLLETKDGGQ